MRNTNEIATQNTSGNVAAFDPKKIELLKRTYAKGATNDEFELFMHLARRYNLDPFAKEIWFVKFGSSAAQIYAGRDGLLKVAHASGQFDGMESAPTFDDSGKLISATAKIYRKDMKYPIMRTAYREEYDTKQNLWIKKPITMLVKVAETQALRAAFTISGVYDPDEMSDTMPNIPEHTTTTTIPHAAPTQVTSTDKKEPKEVPDTSKPVKAPATKTPDKKEKKQPIAEEPKPELEPTHAKSTGCICEDCGAEISGSSGAMSAKISMREFGKYLCVDCYNKAYFARQDEMRNNKKK